MAEATTTEEEVEYADYYQCSGGFTVGMTVCSDGDIVAGEDMGFSKDNPPLSEEEQEAKYGSVMYREYTPEEEEAKALETRTVVQGMQAPGQPKVLPVAAATTDLSLLSREELRTRARKVGLNFPADTDRDQMIGAIDKKEKELLAEAAAEPPAEEEEEPQA
jgi:hypothetical protein